MQMTSEVLPSIEADALRAGALAGPIRIDFGRQLQVAMKSHGLSPATVVKEIALLASGPGRLTPHEYLAYRLYDPTMAFSEKRKFLGKWVQHKMHSACNDQTWFAIANDKLIFAATMSGQGFPVPPLLAVLHDSRHPGRAARLTSAEALRDFLRAIDRPVFAKPIGGMYSLGCISIERVSGATVQLAFGAEATLDEVVERIWKSRDGGYLVQERLSPHPAVERLFGCALSTLRLVVLLGPNGPELARSVWKIPMGRNIADNFWRGNLLGRIDPQSGTLTRVISGTGVDQRELEIHPDTRQQMVGAAVPGWREVREMCLAAAAALPGLRTQSWDVAVTQTGPHLIEVNFGGDMNLPQMAYGAGLLDARYREHLRSCGYRGKL
jgi:hypothetical protein